MLVFCDLSITLPPPSTYFITICLGVLIKGTSYIFRKMPLILSVVIPFIKKAIHSFTCLLISLLFISLQLVEHPPCVGYSSKYSTNTIDHN